MTRKHAMLCYEWSTQNLVLQVREYLTEKGIAVWMDIKSNRSSDNIYEDIATAVENASCLICFMTLEFQQSDYCKLELQYAKKRNIPIIPLKLVQNWEPSSWLGLITAGLIHINIYSTRRSEERLRELYDRICVTIGSPSSSQYSSRMYLNDSASVSEISIYSAASEADTDFSRSKCSFSQTHSTQTSADRHRQKHRTSSRCHLPPVNSTARQISDNHNWIQQWMISSSEATDDVASTWISTDISDEELCDSQF
ncbi:unnamed protein product [Adineta ricciae]|uniref:TIR domain-containing protein n=1 Tax=Adineta ricciae TaxID=249248 RepID=A0A815SW20_ADIRI|nr:unnamed protein product [Adineta ricciae]CAF1524609.1 unnamed protein product [Adineta ricciae]